MIISFSSLYLWSSYLNSIGNLYFAYITINFSAFLILSWLIQIIFLQFYIDAKFSRTLQTINEVNSNFLNNAWVQASKAYLQRQNARTIEDLVDFKGVLKDLETLKNSIKSSQENPALKGLKVLETSKIFVESSLLKASQQMEMVKEDEVRLIEELKLYSFIEIKLEKTKQKNNFVKFIEDHSDFLEEKGFNFNLSSLKLQNHKPIERYSILNQIYKNFSSEKVRFIPIIN